ncbi:hypothetical protein R1flu_011725 [Riccia fluitans]|uniref:Uncharacterized protein n=1 Tax=Riccia fluitans TaxID=41844 RepID=A0ABD1Z8T5_9MARC
MDAANERGEKLHLSSLVRSIYRVRGEDKKNFTDGARGNEKQRLKERLNEWLSVTCDGNGATRYELQIVKPILFPHLSLDLMTFHFKPNSAPLL